MRSIGNRAVKAGVAYTIGNFLIKGINFITLPIFSRMLTTAEFGVYNVFISYEAILYVLIGCAIQSSIRSANIEFRDKINDYTSSVSIIYIINTVILSGITFLFSNQISKLLGLRLIVVISLIIYSFASAIIALYNERIALDYSYKNYLIVSAFNSLGNVIISLVFIITVFNHQKDTGRILGITMTSFILAIFVLYKFYGEQRPKYNQHYWKFAFKYSIPIVPHGISQVLLSQYDRIMIRDMISDSAAGIFSLAGNVKLILTIITASIQTSWSTWFYEEAEQGNNKIIVQKARDLTLVFLVLVLGINCFSFELIDFLGGKEYVGAKNVVIPIVLDAFVTYLYSIIVPAEYYKKKTVYIMIGTMFATVLDIVLNYIFIKKYGYIAAAYTTLFAYMCYLMLHIIISKKCIGYEILQAKFLLLISLIAIVSSVGSMLLMDFLFFRLLLAAALIAPIAFFLIITNKTLVNQTINKFCRRG